MGGLGFPVALTSQTTVTSSPASADVMAPTFFYPFSATTYFGICTVLMPFSSVL